MSTTLVTALFDINRDKYNNQKLALKTIDDYLHWFKKTLQLNCSMVIYIGKKLEKFVLENRPNDYQTKIIIQSKEEIPYYKYKNRIQEIINSNEYKNKIKDPNRIECNLPEYTIIQYSKFEWLKEVSELNPFKTENFFWIDAGCSRFFEDFDLKNEFPGNKFNNLLKNNKNKIFCQSRVDIDYQLNLLREDIFLSSKNLISGGLFGGHKNIIIFLSESINYLFIEKLLNKNIINNEQILIGYIWKNMKDNFFVFQNIYKKHLPLFLIMCN